MQYLSCGDALFDLFVQAGTDPGGINLAGTVGGSTLNVALGLARLGARSGYFTKNSQDLFGVRIARFLEINNIDTRYLVPTPRNSTLAVIEMRPGGVPDYAFYTEGTADRSIELEEVPTDLPDSLEAIHVGSYSTAIEPTASSLEALVTTNADRRFISYDPNIRPTIEPDMEVWKGKIRAFSSAAHFMKASDEDLTLLYGKADPEKFAQDCMSSGVRLVCVTLGSQGAMAFSADGRSERVSGVAVNIVDTVGAGDTFQASCLFWLGTNNLLSSDSVHLADLQSLLEFSTTAAAIACSRRGADLPKLAEVEAGLARRRA